MSDGAQPAKPLKRSTLLYFGLPDYAVYLAAIPVSLYLPFVYSRDLGLELTDIGLILMLARLSDVVTDPLIGYLSDRTRTRFGKRKPWLTAGTVVMMFSAWQLFAPSGAVDNWHLLIWSVLLWLGWTMINIPYFAWGAELSEDYNERTRITGWRQFFGYLGNVSVLLVPTLSGELFGYGSLPKEGLTIVGFMALILLPTLMALALWRVPEPTKHRTTEASLLKSSRQMFSNGSFMLLFTGFLMLSMGTTWASSMFMMLATFVVNVESGIQAILLGFYIIQLLSLPIWLQVSYRIGKKETWLLGAATYCLASPGYMLLGSGDVVELCIVLALYGVAGGNFAAISLSMKADVIDVAAMRTGNHVAGSYMAVWSLGTKLFQAIAIGAALPVLALHNPTQWPGARSGHRHRRRTAGAGPVRIRSQGRERPQRTAGAVTEHHRGAHDSLWLGRLRDLALPALRRTAGEPAQRLRPAPSPPRPGRARALAQADVRG